MRKNRLAQSGPRRNNLNGGVIIQEATVYRDSDPNEAPLPSAPGFLEVSSGATLGGEDMRPALTPQFPETSTIEVQLDATLVADSGEIPAGDQPISASLEISDDGGASWVVLIESVPAANVPQNLVADATNAQRQDLRIRAAAALSVAIPDYQAGTEIIGRALLCVQNSSNSSLVSEGLPANCRVAIREIAA